MCHPLWSHGLDLSQPEQLIHSDVLGSPRRVIHLCTRASELRGRSPFFVGSRLIPSTDAEVGSWETDVGRGPGPQELCAVSSGLALPFGELVTLRPSKDGLGCDQ